MGRTEQRRASRHAVSFPLGYHDGRESCQTGWVTNISVTGLFLETQRPLALGSVITLLPDREMSLALQELPARVVRLEDGPDRRHSFGVGITFDNLDDQAAGALKQLIEDMLASSPPGRPPRGLASN